MLLEIKEYIQNYGVGISSSSIDEDHSCITSSIVTLTPAPARSPDLIVYLSMWKDFYTRDYFTLRLHTPQSFEEFKKMVRQKCLIQTTTRNYDKINENVISTAGMVIHYEDPMVNIISSIMVKI
ncbi:hypothetical protein WA026_015504 [Henosepilachna vigintioctopunctata]|uniref:Uncharacterized protein n=1 Tax=Henosepilachna vigintioctopunctata TaxID=420089 RepID=A0AAW1VFV8_9CUCU